MANLAGRLVLVVEDESMIALLTQTMLSELGCRVLGIAHSVADGLILINANRHCLDAVTLDVNLDGETAEPLAALLEENRIPFVVTTGYDDAQFLAAFGDVPVLEKPFLVEHLAQALMSLKFPQRA